MIVATRLHAEPRIGDFTVTPKSVPCCDSRKLEAIVWSGRDSMIRIEDLAAYCAPILWFSPDEPLLDDATGRDIQVPEPFPFEGDSSARPVVYYRVRNLVTRASEHGRAYVPDSAARGGSLIDLRRVAGIDLDYFFYYHTEAGFGGHDHDVESAEFKLAVWRRNECPDCAYNILVTRVIGKAHGVLWYDNTLSVDQYTRFPITLLVEEGKHATSTDKNGDGAFTPGYDVNRRVNDAWGVRDVLRAGPLFSSSYQSWMTKIRRPEHRVLPPLPADSPRRARLSRGGAFAPVNAVYELRPFPSADRATPELVRFIADKGPADWPSIQPNTGVNRFVSWTEGESFIRSLSVAGRYDGDLGISFVFPLFIVKNFEDPLAKGFVVNRVYVDDKGLRDWAWTLLYTHSASRWIDGYFSGGVEFDDSELPGQPDVTQEDSYFVSETGIKFRVDVQHSAVRFLSRLTDFWGFRAGIKYSGFPGIDRFAYVFELGAGTW